MTPRRVLVTGGAGFIGSHSVDYLLAQGVKVTVLDNLFSGKESNLDVSNPHLEFIEGDVLEYPLLVDLLQNCDAVLHLAAIASVQESINNPVYSFSVNSQGFLHMLQAVKETGRQIRIVYASSAAVYGNSKELPCRENQSCHPLSPYALQKLNCEQYAEMYDMLHGVKSLGLRYFNVYGNRQDPHSPYSGVISRFLELYKKKEELIVYGDGMQSRDFIHVSDIVRANWLALCSSETGVMNIATGKPETINQLIDYIAAAGGREAWRGIEAARPGDIIESYADTHLAAEGLGFKAEISLKEGIKNLVIPAKAGTS
ncbi:MAG TPA: GDP-mannose 4,6-dehydratase [Gammaproteobacteria bacterium]|nr:GDP-mannose 4,6-dehydratase [Gammaproteobacteria bacterium]